MYFGSGGNKNFGGESLNIQVDQKRVSLSLKSGGFGAVLWSIDHSRDSQSLQLLFEDENR
jgi:hypothetical protein